MTRYIKFVADSLTGKLLGITAFLTYYIYFILGPTYRSEYSMDIDEL